MSEGQIGWLAVGVIVLAIVFSVVRDRYENWLYANRRHPVARTYESIAKAIGAFLGSFLWA